MCEWVGQWAEAWARDDWSVWVAALAIGGGFLDNNGASECLEKDTSLRVRARVCICVRELASLCASDVAGHEQKDFVRISRGLDVYFNVFCGVGCVICCSSHKVGQAAALHTKHSLLRGKKLTHTQCQNSTSLWINQINLFMTC